VAQNGAENVRPEIALSKIVTYKPSIDLCLFGQAPRYLADHLIPASDAAPRRGRLRSANRICLTVPRCRLSTYGCRAFDYAGPTVWNSLPDELRNSDSFDRFKRFMKTILFSRYESDQRIRGYFFNNEMCYINLRFAYLLTYFCSGNYDNNSCNSNYNEPSRPDPRQIFARNSSKAAVSETI